MATITQLATIVTAFRCPETPHSHVLRLDTLSSTLKLQLSGLFGSGELRLRA